MFKNCIHLGIISTVVLAGCAGPRCATAPAPGELGKEIASFHASSADTVESGSAEAVKQQETINLRDALVLALMRNPGLEAFSHDMRATEARVLQSSLRPNPEIVLEVDSFDRDGEGSDSAESALVLGQTIELGGKRRGRTRVAEAENELASWNYKSKRLDVFTKTTHRFIEMIAAQRRLELATLTVALAKQTSDTVGERVAAGKEPRVQARKGVAELEMARLDMLDAESTLVVSRKALATMWGAEQPHFQNAVGDFDSILDVLPSIKTLRLRLSSNPDLARGNAELKLQQAALALARANRVPDLEATIGLQQFAEDETDALAFGIGLPLPLFDRNQGGITAAMHELAKTQAERRGVETELAAELVEVHARLTSSHRRVMTLRSRVVPAMKAAFDAAHEGYGRGKFGFLDVLDAQRGLIAVRGNLLTAQSDYHAALADIQRMTGTSIEYLLESKVEETK